MTQKEVFFLCLSDPDQRRIVSTKLNVTHFSQNLIAKINLNDEHIPVQITFSSETLKTNHVSILYVFKNKIAHKEEMNSQE